MGLLRKGSYGDEVAELQQDLGHIGYYKGKVDRDFGPLTDMAVRGFQGDKGLIVDGWAGPKTFAKLDEAIKALTPPKNVKQVPAGYPLHYRLEKGHKGIAVRQVQQALKDRGLLSGKVDGKYGKITTAAVMAYQRSIGILPDGIAGPHTVINLDIDDLKVGELVDWFHGGDELVPKNVPFQIIDVWTGTEITVIRTSGSYHADVEPATAEDAAKYKSLAGRWTWSRRPIIMCLDGRYIAASTHCMPHAGREDKTAWTWVSGRSAGYRTGTNYDVIKGNGVSGHICNHLYCSKGHASKKMDTRHQNCVQIAAGRRAS
mgnify:CR=1 FL=1